MAEKPPPLSQQQQPRAELDQSQFFCSVCLDLFREPVTVPCGHSYCRSCIEACWQRQEEEVAAKGRYSCPQCREVFQPRPVLGRNIILAKVVGKLTGTRTDETSPSAGPEDVACDFCCESRRNVASMSCLTCLASYCSSHLTPHHTVPVLKMHQLISITVSLKEMTCEKHNKLVEVYCQTDKRCICYLCCIDEHRGHRTASVAAERATKQKQLSAYQSNVQRSLQNRKDELKELDQALEDFKSYSLRALDGVDKTIDALICSIQKSRTLAKELIDKREKQAVAEAEELQLWLKEEIAKLRKRDDEIQKLSFTSDHVHFIQTFPALYTTCESPDLPPGAPVRPCESMETASQFIGTLKDKVEDLLKNSWPTFTATVSRVMVVLPPVPKTREQFLLYSRVLSLDVNTVNNYLDISEDKRQVFIVCNSKCYSSHSDRFENVKQVLCREALSERCYWKVKLKGSVCAVAVAYKDIRRSSPHSEFGCNNVSWSFECNKGTLIFRHGGVTKTVSGPLSPVIGVFLDYKAGTVAFYSISESMTLLHEERTTFSQPLYPGLGLKGDGYYSPASVELIKLWQ